MPHKILTAGLAALAIFGGAVALRSDAPATVALTGMVSSPDEGPMEGVLVTAKKAGAFVNITVASDEKGRYNFPRTKLEPGSYTLRIRAAGYDFDDPGALEVGATAAATADLKLHKTANLAAQLTNAEWLMSMPQPDKQKAFFLNCVQCHTVERILRSKHTPEEFMKVMDRMGGYANQSFPLHVQKRKAMRLLEVRGDELTKIRQRQADFMASVNLSAGPSWPYDLKTLPRPKGSDTHVIVTEYDLPRKVIEPHDVMLDSDGMIWYSSFGEQAVGRMDPQTGKLSEFNIPIQKPGWPTGELGLEADPDGNLWFGMTFQGGIAKFDRKTETFRVFNAPAEFNKDMTQINMAAPQASNADGKVWSQNNGFAVIHRYDLATGQTETFAPFKDTKEGENHNIYDVIPDAQNNAYFTPYELTPFDAEKEGFDKITVDLTPRKLVAAAAVKPTLEEGKRLYEMMGCIACHSVDGTVYGKVGPSWKGLYGTERILAKGGDKAMADDAYLKESIINPSAKVVKGYEKLDAGMPIYNGVLNDSQIESLILFIKSLK